MKAHSTFPVLMIAIGLFLPPGVHAENCDGGTYCNDFAELMDYLQSDARRNPEYRIVQPRFGMDTVTPPHRQYDRACYFFGIAPILEQLGYTLFNPGGHYNYSFRYAASDGLKRLSRFDAGYYLSPEHLMAMSVYHESVFNRCEFFSGSWHCDPFGSAGFYSDSSKKRINTTGSPCSGRFDAGEGYGQCSNPATDEYHAWLDATGNGCSGATCRPDADSGMFWFANQVLQGEAGCNDMRSFTPDPGSSSEKKHMRRVVKAFVDHNLPLLVTVRQGGHFMDLIVDYDLESSGLPLKTILHDSSGHYRLASLTDNWNQHDNGSIRGLYPWNHHLDGACEAGGWAAELDSLSTKFKLCTQPDGWSANCMQKRVFGAELICEDNGSERSRYFAYDGDLFITETANTSCDKVKLRYADGEHAIESVTIQRFWYSRDTDTWRSGPVYRPDLQTIGYSYLHDTPVSVVEWDSAWPENYWLVADGLSGDYSKRRTTVRMTLDDGSTRTLEIAPANTYGLELQCIDNGRVTKTYRYEADHGVFSVADPAYRDLQFLYDKDNRSCDALKMRVNLGEEHSVVSARVQRMYYSSVNGEWRAAQPAWWPDHNHLVSDGLSGHSHELIWDAVWPDNYWLTAERVGSGSSYGDRKTVISLLDGSLNVIREIEVVPY